MDPTADQQLWDLAFDGAPVGIALAERRVIRVCNRTFAQMFGYERYELIGRSFRDLYPSAAEFEQFGDIGIEALRASGRYSDERIMARRDGTLFWVRVRATTPHPDDPLSRVVLSFADLSDQRPAHSLTPRERQIVMHLFDGRTSKQIAQALSLSPRTVEAHRARLLRKFGAANVAELLALLSGMPATDR
ncbi:PAS and helix-turn-helix domain-containing protein [Oceanicella actignis]|uniref:PAS domain S-box-containing protein n=1 Tax=Oceanicella actignis TaxID=1189325 RepID=A0A1M7T217_9RHOB|nr:PAS and helix-turn-helix domain-containing protein [Oceanicella actignis]TYO88890.1 PAS domain S-box-containing protein [Oceanicella actignis]SET38443.1 PAS domain S-box-containing protein [Oceanicella actignis]SHN64704.1 PAS domain S-box-containing protein [Oceanicella actignis]